MTGLWHRMPWWLMVVLSLAAVGVGVIAEQVIAAVVAVELRYRQRPVLRQTRCG
jgi:hypothetical protein